MTAYRVSTDWKVGKISSSFEISVDVFRPRSVQTSINSPVRNKRSLVVLFGVYCESKQLLTHFNVPGEVFEEKSPVNNLNSYVSDLRNALKKIRSVKRIRIKENIRTQ